MPIDFNQYRLHIIKIYKHKKPYEIVLMEKRKKSWDAHGRQSNQKWFISGSRLYETYMTGWRTPAS